MRRVNLDRRWWVALIIAVAAVIALVLSQTVFRGTSEECKPVVELLDFNRAQAELISSKTSDEDAPAVPSQAEEIAYQAWADGLAERAQKVTEPELASSAVKVADLASQFVGKLSQVRAETAARAPGAPAPPVVYEMSALNDRITTELATLSKACEK